METLLFPVSATNNKSVFLTHGEYDGMLELRESIVELNMNCEIPDYDWELVIE